MKKIIVISLILASLQLRAQNILRYNFESRMDGISILWIGDSLNFWGFRDLDDGMTNGATLPGPTIICNEGDSVVINMTNPSFEAHTIHPHGLDVDQLNDGVPNTSFFVQPNQTGTYSIKAAYAGNYLYHCHVGTVLHLQLGMYGAFIVKAANGASQAYTGGPSYDREFMWMTNEVDKSWHDDYTTIGGFMNYFPDFFHVNGKSRQQIWNDSDISINNAYVGENIFLRIMNIGFGLNQYIFPPGLNPVQITSDGRALPTQVNSDTIRVFPGERFGVMIQPQQLMNDSIKIQFLSMYRDQEWGEEQIPINVNSTSYLSQEIPKSLSLFYPNPGNGILNFRKQHQLIEIIDNQGRVVRKQNNTQFIQTSDLKRGVYTVRSKNNDGVSTEKLIVQ